MKTHIVLGMFSLELTPEAIFLSLAIGVLLILGNVERRRRNKSGA